MSRHFLSTIAVALLILLGMLSGKTYAVTLYNQPSDQRGFFFSDPSFPIFIADRFTLATDAIVTDVHWYGAYGNSSTVTSAQFRIQFYNDDNTGTFPANSPFYGITALASATDTGTVLQQALASPIMLFSLDSITPISLLGGVGYWLSIVETDVSTTALFEWTSAPGIGTIAGRVSDAAAWDRLGTAIELAYSLTGTTVPEPATMLLLGSGLLGLWGARKKFKK